METVNRTDDLELGCDLTFERRWWRIQRIGWVILTLLILGGVLGIFGGDSIGLPAPIWAIWAAWVAHFSAKLSHSIASEGGWSHHRIFW